MDMGDYTQKPKALLFLKKIVTLYVSLSTLPSRRVAP